MQTKVAGSNGLSGASCAEVSIGLGWVAALERVDRGALLRVQHPQQGALAVEIELTSRGPVIRASAVAIELDATTDVIARCNRFTVDARERITLDAPEIVQRAGGKARIEADTVDIDARTGDVYVHANDDVQLLGERILLNCDREVAIPSWVPSAPEVTLPAAPTSGDADLCEVLRRGKQ